MVPAAKKWDVHPENSPTIFQRGMVALRFVVNVLKERKFRSNFNSALASHSGFLGLGAKRFF